MSGWRPSATPEGVAVTVGDNGIGMSPEDMDVALQPFGQVDNRLERRYEGTGLGLPLTSAFVELHRRQHGVRQRARPGHARHGHFPAKAETRIFAKAV